MRQLELRRHARRDPEGDRLSSSGRSQAEDLGRAASVPFDVVFVSPAERAAETAAWILRGAGTQLPAHEVVPGLAGQDAEGGTVSSMAAGVRAMLARVPDGGRGLAVSHTPFVERATEGLTGRKPTPFAETEGILVTVDDDGAISVEELRA
jgi:phosphohistidine phosphatase SixA